MMSIHPKFIPLLILFKSDQNMHAWQCHHEGRIRVEITIILKFLGEYVTWC